MHRYAAILSLVCLSFAGFSCGDSKTIKSAQGGGPGDGGLCDEGAETCPCYPNQTCDDGLMCLSGLCVENAGSGGSSGSGGDAGASGSTGSGGDGGSAGSGGDGGTGGGSGGTGGDGGSTGGTGGDSGSGGSSATGGSSGTGGSPGDTCGNASSSVVDNFFTCDTRICDLGGRQGSWYAFADTGVNQNFAVSVPGSGWVDRSCAAWTIGGPLAYGTQNFAGIGLVLADGSPYDLRHYTGVTIWLESDADVWFVVKAADGGQFGGWLAATTGNQARTLSFASLTRMLDSTVDLLDLSQALDLQFTAKNPSGFGFAIHSVLLITS
jgi:hypothetical protein